MLEGDSVGRGFCHPTCYVVILQCVVQDIFSMDSVRHQNRKSIKNAACKTKMKVK